MEEAVKVFGVSRGGGRNNCTSFIFMCIRSSVALVFKNILCTNYPIEVYQSFSI